MRKLIKWSIYPVLVLALTACPQPTTTTTETVTVTEYVPIDTTPEVAGNWMISSGSQAFHFGEDYTFNLVNSVGNVTLEGTYRLVSEPQKGIELDPVTQDPVIYWYELTALTLTLDLAPTATNEALLYNRILPTPTATD